VLWDGASGLLPDEVLRPFVVTDTADPEVPALAAGVLTLETSEDAELMGYVQAGALIAPGDPWVIEFEMRLVSGMGIPARQPAIIFVTTAPSEGVSFQIGMDTILLLSAQSTVGETAALDTDDAFHVYRVEVFGDGSVDVYYDDLLTIEGNTYTSASDHGPELRVGWGHGSTFSFGQSEWLSFGHDGAAEICGDGIIDPAEQCDDGNTDPGDGCDALCQDEIPPAICAPAPAAGCLTVAKASVAVKETKPDNEKLKAKWKGFSGATGQGDFGDPLNENPRYDLCLYDQGGQLVAELSVDRGGQSCGPKQKPCFKDKGGKGWLYRDPSAEADGTKKLVLSSGPIGKGKALWQAGNKLKKGQMSMPTGITAALNGETSVTLQLVAASGATCFEAALGTVKKADGVQFKARAP